MRFAECAVNALQDHHAILGVSSPRSYGLTPSYNDLWVEVREAAMWSPMCAPALRPRSPASSQDGASALSRFADQ
ncbi:MAG: hypothetical protein JKP95_01455 [Oceanicaulis sp.]|nr:hypothetical protein [Oceanicaulis sp.]